MKSNMKSLMISAALAATAIATSLPAQADPPPWAPAHGHRAKQQKQVEYKYVYYPAQQVYYAPSNGTWFWMNGGNWQVGVNLPTRFQGTVSSGVPVVLHSERPYVEHVVVEERYGRPWREKHKHKHKHGKHDRDDDEGHGHGHGRHRD